MGAGVVGVALDEDELHLGMIVEKAHELVENREALGEERRFVGGEMNGFQLGERAFVGERGAACLPGIGVGDAGDLGAAVDGVGNAVGVGVGDGAAVALGIGIGERAAGEPGAEILRVGNAVAV